MNRNDELILRYDVEYQPACSSTVSTESSKSKSEVMALNIYGAHSAAVYKGKIYS